jgi:hypothetical protein
MPSSKFVVPVNGQDFPANTAFTIQMAINHLETGNFVNAQANYYAAPQQINGQGDIVGHSHFTVQDVGSFTSTTPLDPNVFAFFKGVNAAAVNGILSETVSAGLPAGAYRVCSMNTDANHTPCLVAVAQHGSLDDCVYVSYTLSVYLVFRLISVCSSPSVVQGTTTNSRATAPAAEPVTLPLQPLLLLPLRPLLLLQLRLLLPPRPLLLLQLHLLPLRPLPLLRLHLAPLLQHRV